MISTALAKKPSAIAIAAIDSQATIPLLQQAKDANIPVIAFDSGVASDIPITSCSTDNLASAALAADKMAELIGGEGKVGIVSFDQTSQTGIERRDGFVEQIKTKYPKIEIVGIEYGGGDHLKSAEITKTMLQAYPDLKGIFGTNEGAAIGVSIGKKEAGSNVVVIGYDSGAAQIAAVRDGTIAGAITQNPVGIGYKSVEAALKAIKGEPSRSTSTPASTGTTRPTSTIRRSPLSSTTDHGAAAGGDDPPPASGRSAASATVGILP